jgi:hypothetical protein
MEYLPDASNPDRRFSLSYRELREEHERMVALDDAAFVAQLPAAAHLACIIGWLKELGRDETIGDTGIVHELVHLMHLNPLGAEPYQIGEVRARFARLLLLAP